MKLLLSFLLTVLSVGFVSAQASSKRSECGYKIKIGLTKPDCSKPIVFGTANDGYPDTIKIKGEIVDLTFTEISCGVLCLWGTAKIRLDKRPRGFEQDYAYITVLCFGGDEKNYIGKKVDLQLRKSSETEYVRLSCTIFRNFLDSEGSPFYYVWNKNSRKRYYLHIT